MRKLLLGLIGLMFAVPGWATDLPVGYTELEYIESTGTQYIDTGVKFTSGSLVIDADVYYTNAFPHGSQRMFVGNGVFGVGVYQTNRAYTYAPSQNANTALSTVTGVWHHFIAGEDKTFNYLTVDGVAANTTSHSTDGAYSQNNIELFAGGNSGAWYRSDNGDRLKTVKMTINGTPVRDMVPVRRNSDNVVGMYDTVSGTFFTNAGTGTFIAGPEVQIKIATTAYNSARFSPVVTELNDTIATIRSVVTNTINQTKAIADLQATKQTRPNETCPAGKKCLLVEDDAGMPHWYEIIENAYGLPNGYTGLEYIQSTGTQYIDTGISITSGNFQIDADMQFTSTASPQYFGIYGGGYFGITDDYFAAGGRTISKSADTQRHKFIFSSIIGTNVLLNLSIDGTNYNISRDVSAGRINLLVVDNRGALMGETKAKLYSAQIYSNGTLVRDMIPAKNASGVIGMYDTVSGRFFTNTGTGTFTAGPEI